jgi:hypothetical protein
MVPENTILSVSRRVDSLDYMIDEFFNHLQDMSFDRMTQLYSKAFIETVYHQISSSETCTSKLAVLYANLQRAPVEAYDVLIKYKVPFSALGIEQVLVYTKLTSGYTDRYMAVWFKRDLYGQSSWTINDMYVHDASSDFSLSVEDPQVFNDHLCTISGQLVSDSTLASLFFTRIFVNSTDADHMRSEHDSVTNTQRCNRALLRSIQKHMKTFVTSLYQPLVSQSIQVVSLQLNACIELFKDSHLTSDVGGDRGESLTDGFHILELYRIPTRSQWQTRVLVHLYVPSVKSYVSAWFTRSLHRGLAWLLEDFYIHQFGNIESLAFADKEYCLEKFRTLKARVFYTPDLIGEYVLNSFSA